MPKLFVSKEEIQAKTGLTFVYSFLVIFVVSTLVVYLANLIFPSDVVLGTASLTPWWALHHSMTKLALISILSMALVYVHEWKRGKMYSTQDWMVTYFVVNTVSIWLISRLSTVYGLGISHWWVAILLGAALDWAQGMGMMALAKIQKQSN